jgi:DNA mismatch repair protein MutS2
MGPVRASRRLQAVASSLQPVLRMAFPIGADVLVVAINRRGRVIDVRGGAYRVLVGALPVMCREHELRAVETPKTGKRQKRRDQHASARSHETAESNRPPVTRSIDLHGMTVEEARAAVADFLSRALVDGADTLEIIHGIGTGRVRDAIRRALGSIGAVRQVRPHPTNPGVTIVHL